mmetsp:Transcript_35018/g.93883  ORF Transcript_35018/g.93883 Transcript_35018/m.93883 type:complete len:253 (+) Transcript_35018:1171-1929(+)
MSWAGPENPEARAAHVRGPQPHALPVAVANAEPHLWPVLEQELLPHQPRHRVPRTRARRRKRLTGGYPLLARRRHQRSVVAHEHEQRVRQLLDLALQDVRPDGEHRLVRLKLELAHVQAVEREGLRARHLLKVPLQLDDAPLAELRGPGVGVGDLDEHHGVGSSFRVLGQRVVAGAETVRRRGVDGGRGRWRPLFSCFEQLSRQVTQRTWCMRKNALPQAHAGSPRHRHSKNVRGVQELTGFDSTAPHLRSV